MKQLVVVALLMALFFPGPVFGHLQNSALTVLSVKADQGGIEVMHRFYVHDVEKAVKTTSGEAVDFIQDEKAQATFGRHVMENFSLRDTEKGELALEYIGHEVDGKFFWVYQEYRSPIDVKAISVFHSALVELFPKQRNLVNLEYDSVVKSLFFDKGDTWKTFAF